MESGKQSLQVVTGLLALWTAIACADPVGTAGNPVPMPSAVPTPSSAVLPSIEILLSQTKLAGSCGGAAFNLNTFIRVDTQASADVRVSAPGVGTIETFIDETGTNVGPFAGNYPTFNIKAFGGGLPPGTPITINIGTYTGHALSGTLSYSSFIQFDCTTGAVLRLAAASPADVANQIPTLSEVALAATAALLGLAGLVALRRRPQGVRSPRPARRPSR
ncbi:MAG: IPTL-CTERM sorting domain-containing protein [Casimicrobiaceae bacterium]